MVTFLRGRSRDARGHQQRPAGGARVSAAFHLGWYLNRYAKWYRIEHFATVRELIEWLQVNAPRIDGPIDFISETIQN